MLTDKALADSIEALNERAKTEIALQLVNKPAQPGLPAAATVAAATAPAPGIPAGNTAATTGWTPQDRIYLDCMEEQAKKYSGLNESATVVADVAQSRCRSYQGGSNAALEQEGRALAMGLIMDAKLAKPGGK
jgi:hypothetical protein